MSEEVRLRDFAGSDVMALREVFAQSIEYLTQQDYDEDQRFAWVSGAADERAFTERFDKVQTWVAESEGEIAGFISLAASGEAIDMLFVHPHFTLLGVGSTLLGALEAHAIERGVAKMAVEASDTSRPFFEKRGFEGSQRNLMPREDQWLGNTTMTKELVKAESGS